MAPLHSTYSGAEALTTSADPTVNGNVDVELHDYDDKLLLASAAEQLRGCPATPASALMSNRR